MADDIQVTPGSGGTYMRTREVVSGRHAQIVFAGEHVRVFDGVQSLTLTGSALTLTVPGSATHCLVFCDGAADTDYARYWQDGTSPTASVGKKLMSGEELPCASPSTFKAIIGAGSPVLRVEYYHYA